MSDDTFNEMTDEIVALRQDVERLRRDAEIAMSALVEACTDGWSDGIGALESYLRAARERYEAAALTTAPHDRRDGA